MSGWYFHVESIFCRVASGELGKNFSLLLTVLDFSFVLGKLFFVLKLDFLGDVLFVASLAHLRLKGVCQFLKLSVGL